MSLEHVAFLKPIFEVDKITKIEQKTFLRGKLSKPLPTLINEVRELLEEHGITIDDKKCFAKSDKAFLSISELKVIPIPKPIPKVEPKKKDEPLETVL